jgi:hypothetical protein
MNLRIFGNEALSYIEKEKRPKFQPKVERTIYLGTSTDHSEDTYKLYRTKTQDIIFRRNVYFNERSFTGRKLQPIANLQDDGTDLIGLDFEDDGILCLDGHEDWILQRNSSSLLQQQRKWRRRIFVSQGSKSVVSSNHTQTSHQQNQTNTKRIYKHSHLLRNPSKQ